MYGKRGRALTPQQRRYATPAASYRSGLEEKLAAQIEKAGQTVRHETLKLPFVEPTKKRSYLPDLILDNGIVIEAKGYFTGEDRKKHQYVKAQHPEIELRFIFCRSATKLSKLSPTSYGKWATDHGFMFADKEIPNAWLNEPPNEKSLAALRALGAKV